MAARLSMPDEWIGWDDRDPTRKPVCAAPGLYTLDPPQGWSAFAQWASRHTPGMWFPKQYGCTWTQGRRRQWFVLPELVPEIVRARAICESLGVEAGWSVGSCAFALLRWLDVRQWPERSARLLLAEHGRAYQQVMPGVYDDALHLDVSSYYYSLWTRLPSLVVHCFPDGRLVWARTPAPAWERHRRCCEAVAAHKWLRNALVGCAQGSASGGPYFHRGERRLWRGSYGPLAPAGWLVVRSGWELTRLAAEETEAVYSHTDSVITTGGRWPAAWEAAGLAVKVEARGTAEVCAPGIYRVGPRASRWYERGSRFADPIPPTPAPRHQYAPRWLAA